MTNHFLTSAPIIRQKTATARIWRRVYPPYCCAFCKSCFSFLPTGIDWFLSYRRAF